MIKIMSSLLIITTESDISEPLFYTPQTRDLATCTTIQYKDSLTDIDSALKNNPSYIYLRDPFTGVASEKQIQKAVNYVLKNRKKSAFIDNISSFQDILFEDKFNQYQTFQDLMPETYILSEYNQEEEGIWIIKKRISSRARDVHFTRKRVAQAEYENYIVQRIIPVNKEYRIIGVGDVLLDQVLVKTPKTPTSKVKVVGHEHLSHDLKEFALECMNRLNYDLFGLDIVQSTNGTYHLLEVNRSPQFSSYYAQVGINPAESLLKHICG